MSTGKEQISARQLMYSIACYISGSSLITAYISVTAKQETWIAVITGYIASLLVIVIYDVLIRLYPGQDIVQINISVYGNIAGRIISLLYVYFFFSLAFLNTRQVGEIMNGLLMPRTPVIAILILFVFICAWAVRNGVETMTRCSTLYVVATITVVFITSMLLIKDMKISNLLPVFSLPFCKYVQATHTMANLPFCEVMSFFMLFPHVKEKDEISRSLFKGLTLGAALIMVVILRNAVVLGPLISLLSSPTFEAVRLIDVGHVLTRMEILYVGILIMLIFFKVTIVFFAAVAAASKVFNLHSYRTIVPVVGSLIVVFALEAFDSVAESAYWGANVAAVYSMFFEVMLPVITLLAIGCKKLISAMS